MSMAEQSNLIDIYIMGRHCRVPAGLTILTALEYSGYRLLRGCGCRAGFCGACATVFNYVKDPQLRFDLACQKGVEQGMCIVQIPFFPATRANYNIENIKVTDTTLKDVYPDILTCFGCNTCTRACPQELEVMWFMSDALRGDIKAVAEKSFDCVMCGLCAARCPQGLAPYNVSLLARRLYGKYLAPRSEHLEQRIDDIEAGADDAAIEELKSTPKDELCRRYHERSVEPALEQTWE